MTPGYYDFRHVFIDTDGEMCVDIQTFYAVDEIELRNIRQKIRDCAAHYVREEISLNYTPEYIY